MTLSQPIERFWIAPFVLDGELLGIGEWWIKDLSSHWIDVCASLLEHYGPIFDQHLQGPLSHIRIRCTAIDSGAMVVLYAYDVAATSFVVVLGAAPPAEAQMLSMFAESVRSSTLHYQVAGLREPFHEMSTLIERPIAMVVPWAQSSVSEEDHELVTELMRHFTAALIINLSK
ncbi:hypothetical protein [Sphingomonas koreensis]